MTSLESVCDLIENAPAAVSEVASLYTWSTNYDPGKGPMTLFLDLIGWSGENIGEPLYSLKNAPETLGYLELDYLADALKQYANNPGIVREFVDDLMEAEGRE